MPQRRDIMQALYTTPTWAYDFYVFDFFTLFFEGGGFFYAWCMMYGAWFMMHTCAFLMPCTFLPSYEFFFPLWTSDRISGLGSVLLWLSRLGVVNILLRYYTIHPIKGCLPLKVVFYWRSSSPEGCLSSKFVFHLIWLTIICWHQMCSRLLKYQWLLLKPL